MHSSKNHVSIADGAGRRAIQRGPSKRLCLHAQIKAKTAVEMQYLVHGQAADVFCCTGGPVCSAIGAPVQVHNFVCSFGGGGTPIIEHCFKNRTPGLRFGFSNMFITLKHVEFYE